MNALVKMIVVELLSKLGTLLLSKLNDPAFLQEIETELLARFKLSPPVAAPVAPPNP